MSSALNAENTASKAVFYVTSILTIYFNQDLLKPSLVAYIIFMILTQLIRPLSVDVQSGGVTNHLHMLTTEIKEILVLRLYNEYLMRFSGFDPVMCLLVLSRLVEFCWKLLLLIIKHRLNFMYYV